MDIKYDYREVIRRASGSTSGSLKFSDGLRKSREWSRVVSAEVK